MQIFQLYSQIYIDRYLDIVLYLFCLFWELTRSMYWVFKQQQIIDFDKINNNSPLKQEKYVPSKNVFKFKYVIYIYGILLLKEKKRYTYISIYLPYSVCFFLCYNTHTFPLKMLIVVAFPTFFHSTDNSSSSNKKKNRKKYSQTKITSFLPFHTLFAGSLSFTKPRDFLAEKLGEKHKKIKNKKNINSENHHSLTNTIIHHKAISKRLTKQPTKNKIK